MNKCKTFIIFSIFTLLNSWSFAKDQSSRNLCLKSYVNFQEYIHQNQLQDIVRHLDNGWFEIAYPTEDGFVLKKTDSWNRVVELLQHIPIEQKVFAEDILSKAQVRFNEIISHFKTVAIFNKAQFFARLKDITSLRNKLFDRLKSRSLTNSVYSHESIDDLMGLRMVVGSDSRMLDPTLTESDYRSILQLAPKSMDVAELQIDRKGSEKYRQEGKFYRAVHITLKVDESTTAELQIMSKAVSFWHSWDHPIVYKGDRSNPEYYGNLKNYSKAWIEFITTLEDFHLSKAIEPTMANEKNDIHYSKIREAIKVANTEKYNNLIRLIYKLLERHQISNFDPIWFNRDIITNFNHLLLERYGVKLEHQFLVEKKPLGFFKKRNVFKELSKLLSQ